MTTLPDFFKAATRHDPYLCQRRLAKERPLPRLRPIGFRVEEARPAYRVRRRQRRLG